MLSGQVVEGILGHHDREEAKKGATSFPANRDGYGPLDVGVANVAWDDADALAALIDELDGDRGLGPLLAAHPGRVLRVTVAGTNPDVDTPAQLAALERTLHAT